MADDVVQLTGDAGALVALGSGPVTAQTAIRAGPVDDRLEIQTPPRGEAAAR